MRVLGIDPGVRGAAALVSCSAEAFTIPKIENIFDFEVIERKQSNGKVRNILDIKPLFDFIDNVRPELIISEKMQPSPMCSVVSAFSMGQTMGQLLALFSLYKLPFKFVSPNQWKSALSCPADKEQARQHAINIFGDKYFKLKKDHNQSEAALIALYGIRTACLDRSI